MPLEALASGSCAVGALAHFASTGLVAWRAARDRRRPAAPPTRPPVTLLRPVRGLENHLEDALASSFALDWPEYEVLFCVADADDPVVPLVERLIAAHPHVPARLLIGDDPISINPKLNNTVKGWRAARFDHVAMVDSNVVLPPDFLARLLAAWKPGTGLVCAPPVGARAENFWAELEVAFLNTYQTRWQLFADLVGTGFAQGKVMLYRRSILEPLGGIEALAAEPAEDAATTKLLRRAGYRIRLVPRPFEQALGRRTFREVWNRQVRWARLRRETFPHLYAAEIGSGAVLPSLACGLWAWAAGMPVLPALGLLLAFWYAAEIALARSAGWPVGRWSVPAMLLRDLAIPVLYLQGWLGNRFVWRGNAMSLAEPAGGG
ncbi:MAG: ceramide glucosyltransferase [Geminicoccaceae bacterium]|nr:MAG: ceramide glucosyltransferase [Geminicoccaceae bacterium]